MQGPSRAAVRLSRRVGIPIVFGLLVSLPAAAGEVGTLPPSPVFTPTPESADVHAFEKVGGSYEFTNPYIPPVSNSQDHRIGLIRKQGGGGTARFVLLAPERLSSPVVEVDGAGILASTIYSVSAADFHDATATATHTPDIAHLALCDPKEPAPNPYVCGDSDCYDMKAITGLVFSDSDPNDPVDHPPYIELWSAPLTVEVTTPKTASASIAQVTVHGRVGAPPVHGYSSGGIRSFHTPLIVGDNRLLIVRFGHLAELEWQDAQGQTHTGRYDPVYASYPDDGNPAIDDECDVTQWTDFKPLANAPHDPNLIGRYGFASTPFTSPSGASIPHTYGIRGRYLWVDQKANNVFFGTLSRFLHKDYLGDGSCGSSGDCLYDIACVPGVPCDLTNAQASEATPPHQGWMMMGLWTHGKMVLLDSMINHSDFGLQGEEEHHRMVTLYDDGPAIRVGTGRDADPVTGTAHGWIDTTVQLGSTEHFFNMVPHMRLRTPRDVVWLVTAGAQTDEIAFDDYLNHRTLIFSPMNALKEMVGTQVYHDGRDPNSSEMRLQNAATSLDFALPAYGEVVVPAGTDDHGRIENVALGGIEARGFYLDPESRIEYETPAQSGLENEEWVVSLFYDLKVVSSQVRRLFTFPGGDYVDLHGLWYTRICGGGGFGCRKVRLPKKQSTATWTHLAYHLVDDKIRLYQDGFLFAEVDRPAGMLIEPGTFKIGSPAAGTLGAGGWIDDLRVVAGPVNDELLCNHARGTLVAVPHTYDTLTGNHLADLLAPFEAADADSDLYPDFVSGREAIHDALHGPSAKAWALSDYYVCNIDYTQSGGVSVYDAGDPLARSVRRRMLFPEGPLVWNQPRPDSASNPFCLSCHQSTGQGGLGLEALTLDPATAAHADPRRQPSQPPHQVFGMMPAHYFDVDAPPAETVDAEIDRWVDDGPLYRWTLDEAGGASFHNWVIGDVNQPSNGGSRNQSPYKPGAGRGHALAFDGVDDSAPIDHNLSIDSEELTLAAWFRPYRNGGVAPEDGCRIDVGVDSPCTLIAKSFGDVYWSLQAFYLADDPDPRWRARLEVRGDNGMLEALEVDLDDPATPAANDFVGTWWHHLAGTYGGGELEIYLDGDSMGTATVTSRPLATSSNHPVTLGSELDGLGAPVAPYYGRLDDVRIYDRRLRPGEIPELVADTP
ncbi:MAG: LamG domain-containing protein [bacterium]|nr:LamG domain-containing protein [bacterium]